MIEGTYDLNGQRMQTYNRIVIATGAGADPDRIPGPAHGDQLRRPGRRRRVDVEAIIKGFTVAAK